MATVVYIFLFTLSISYHIPISYPEFDNGDTKHYKYIKVTSQRKIFYLVHLTQLERGETTSMENVSIKYLLLKMLFESKLIWEEK